MRAYNKPLSHHDTTQSLNLSIIFISELKNRVQNNNTGPQFQQLVRYINKLLPILKVIFTKNTVSLLDRSRGDIEAKFKVLGFALGNTGKETNHRVIVERSHMQKIMIFNEPRTVNGRQQIQQDRIVLLFFVPPHFYTSFDQNFNHSIIVPKMYLRSQTIGWAIISATSLTVRHFKPAQDSSKLEDNQEPDSKLQN